MFARLYPMHCSLKTKFLGKEAGNCIRGKVPTYLCSWLYYKEYLLSRGSGCGSIGRVVASHFHRSAVRIQSSVKCILNTLFTVNCIVRLVIRLKIPATKILIYVKTPSSTKLITIGKALFVDFSHVHVFEWFAVHIDCTYDKSSKG